MGLEEVKSENSKFKSHPNPAKEILNVELSLSYLHTLAQNSTGVLPPLSKGEGAEAELQIIDVLGKVIKHSTLTTKHSQIDVSDFPSGVYFIRSSNGARAKFVKQ